MQRHQVGIGSFLVVHHMELELRIVEGEHFRRLVVVASLYVGDVVSSGSTDVAKIECRFYDRADV